MLYRKIKTKAKNKIQSSTKNSLLDELLSLKHFQSKKEIQKRMLVKKTLNLMNKQIEKLEQQKEQYINAGREAKQRGLTAQYDMALSGLRMTLIQQKRVYEMKLNFEITSQMKDMSQMTVDFLNGMGLLSKEMMQITKVKDFGKVQKQFEEAMVGAEVQMEQLESFMESTETSFSASFSGTTEEKQELDSLISIESQSVENTDALIEKELSELKKKIAEM